MEERAMRNHALRAFGVALLFLVTLTAAHVRAQASEAPALAGEVSSRPEGPLEGVLVTAKRDGSTITTTVVTNAQGQYSFPRKRLAAGRYAITVRASGFELPAATTVDVAAQGTTRRDLALNKVTDPLKLA